MSTIQGTFNDSIEQTQTVETEKASAKPLVIMSIALFIIAVASFVLAYSYHSSFQQMMDRSFKMTQLTTQQALLYITVPVVGTALLIGMGLYIRSKHHERLDFFRDGVQELVLNEQIDPSIKTTIQQMRPTRRQLAITAMVLGTLAIIGFIGFAVCKWLPAGNQWWGQVGEPLFNHPFVMWEALAYFGGVAAAIAVIVGLASVAIQNKRLKAEEEKVYKTYEDEILKEVP